MQTRSEKNAKSHLFIIILCTGLIAAAVCGFVLFIFFNGRTRQTVQAERENYTSEIAGQLTRNIENLQNAYARELREDIESLQAIQPMTLDELQKLYPDSDNNKHYLITADGQVADTAGKVYTISDEFFSKKISLAADNEVVMTYTTVNLASDYLLFGKRLKPLTIGKETYVAWVAGITSDQFRQNMTISLFDGIGAGYLISGDGAVVIKPNDNSMVFSGYNFFSALAAGGVPDSQIEEIQSGMQTGSGAITVTVDRLNWLISYKSTEFDGDYIMVAVPLSLTAADTYRNMNLTVVFAFIFIIALSGVAGLILLSSSRRRQEEDRRAAATNAQTNFLAKMSHDIRTPLNAVTGMLELASDPRHSRAEVDAFVAKARKSASYLLELINGMLDLQKIESGKMEIAREPFSMAELLDSISSMYTPVLEEKGLAFAMDGSEQFDADYLGDGTKIKQILMNLLSNAMKFTPKGGSVAVAGSRKPLDGGRDEVLLSVTDTGIGMSEEFQKRIFLPFEQEKTSTTSHYVGTGLGLNIVKSLTELMGGTVSVESAPGKGSRFSIRLPLDRGGRSPAADRRKQTKEIIPFSRQRILLAEDNAINQQIAVLLMQERLNLEVDAVDDGQMAVDAMKRSPPNGYAAVVLDVRMPVMDGLQAAQAIRALDRPDAGSVPILALSANTYEEDVRQSLDAGMNAHLSKPIDIGELSDALHKFIQ